MYIIEIIETVFYVRIDSEHEVVRSTNIILRDFYPSLIFRLDLFQYVLVFYYGAHSIRDEAERY